MKSYKKESTEFKVQDRRPWFGAGVPALDRGGMSLMSSRGVTRAIFSNESSYHDSRRNKHLMESTDVLDLICATESIGFFEHDWKMTFGEYLLKAMMDQSVFPRHISEETELSQDYVDQILEDEILPWDLSANLIRYLNERLNLNPDFTKRIIAEQYISQDIVEKLHYSPTEYDLIDNMDPDIRKTRFKEFLRQEEIRQKNFLRMI